MSSRLLIIDGYSLGFRAYYSFPLTLTDSKGSVINVIFGFITMLYKGIDNLKPTHLCVCFDRKEPTFRHKMYSDYKAHRPPPPEHFIEQMMELKDILKQMEIPVLEVAGYEADDIFGTLSKQADTQKIDSLIMTGDHDALQLVSKYTSVVMNKRGTSDLLVYDDEEVMKKYSLSPSQIVDYKAIRGDSSDNIPGVKGIGEKGAVTLLHKYKNLKAIYEHVSEITPPGMQKKLIENKEMAFLSYELASINCNVPLEKTIADYVYQPNWENVISIFSKYQFRSLLLKYEKNASPQTIEEAKNDPIGDYQLVTELKELESLLPQLHKGFAIDLETTSLDIQKAQIVGIALSIKENTGIYIALNKFLVVSSDNEALQLFSATPQDTTNDTSLNPFLECLKPILESQTIPKYTHNGKYDYLVLRQYDIDMQNIAFDSMIAAFLLHPGDRIGLKALASRYLNVEMTDFETLTGSKNNLIQDVPLEDAARYAACDADMTLRLKQLFEPQLTQKKLNDLYYDIELPTQRILAEMEFEGVCLNTSFLSKLHDKYTKELSALTLKIYSLAGVEFNIKSPKQLGDVLFDTLELPVIKKTKTSRSTDSSVLEKLKKHHDIAESLIKYRTLDKLLSTYIDALPQLISAKTGRIHTSFNQTVAITGRLSSTQPNLQNIPIRTQEGQLIRQAFVPSSPDRVLLSADYSQIELRLLAHLAQDNTMIQAFCKGEDIHKSTAAMVFSVPIDQVTDEQRYQAKAVNFGIIYGMSPFGLSENLNISRESAKQMIDDYFKHFSKIKDFMNDTIEFTKEHGYVRTEFGRYRYIPDIENRVANKRQFAERAAINTRVQGTAADIMKLSMLRVIKAKESLNLEAKLLIQVHDELVFDVPKSEYEQLAALLKKEMESVVSYDVPLKVNMVSGENWKEAK